MANLISYSILQLAQPEEVQAFHSAAFSAGGKDNREPKLHDGGHPPACYPAFVLDPDSNNIEAVFREG